MCDKFQPSPIEPIEKETQICHQFVQTIGLKHGTICVLDIWYFFPFVPASYPPVCIIIGVRLLRKLKIYINHGTFKQEVDTLSPDRARKARPQIFKSPEPN